VTECGETTELQEETQTKETPVLARSLKVRLDSGYEDFAAVFHVTAEGVFVD
jgi:hypothetical protein